MAARLPFRWRNRKAYPPRLASASSPHAANALTCTVPVSENARNGACLVLEVAKDANEAPFTVVLGWQRLLAAP